MTVRLTFKFRLFYKPSGKGLSGKGFSSDRYPVERLRSFSIVVTCQNVDSQVCSGYKIISVFSHC